MSIALARFNTDGSIDTSMGAAGKIVTSVYTYIDYAEAALLQACTIQAAPHIIF